MIVVLAVLAMSANEMGHAPQCEHFTSTCSSFMLHKTGFGWRQFPAGRLPRCRRSGPPSPP